MSKCINNRRIILNKELSKNDYIFARIDDKKKWGISNGKSNKYDKIFIRVKWFDKNVANKEDDEDDEDNEDNEEQENHKEVKDEITMAPAIIKLKKSEKIKDDNNNILDIEVRGSRRYDDCYFRVSDVAKGFEIEKLHDIIIKKGRGYKENEHYRYFYFSKNTVNDRKNKKIKDKNKKIIKLFLTYFGFLKVLFSSRNKNATKFAKWAAKILFTVQMGTNEQKTGLVSKLMGIFLETIKAVFNKTSDTLPCIYFFTLGKVKNLRETFSIGDEYDDEDELAKFGCTDNLIRRTK